MKKYLSLFVFCCPSILFSQISTFERSYGTSDYESLSSFIQTSDGGYLLAGSKGSSPQLLKTDNTGIATWAVSPPYSLNAVLQTADGGYVACGASKVSKFSSSGNVLWTKYYPNVSSLSSVKKTFDSGFILSGTYSYGDILLMKIDSVGALQWSQKIGKPSSYDEYGHDAIQMPDSSYIVTGYGMNSGPMLFGNPTSTGIVCRFSSNGTLIWSKCIPYLPATYEKCTGVYNLAVRSAGRFTWTTQWNNLILIEMDTSGTILSSLRFAAPAIQGYYGCSTLQKTSDQGCLVTGVNQFTTNETNIRVVKLDSLLNIQWQRNIGGPKDERPCGTIETSDGGIAVAGITYSFSAGESDMYLSKCDPAIMNCHDSAISIGTSAVSIDTMSFPGAVSTAFIPSMDQFLSSSPVVVPGLDACSCVPPVANFVSYGAGDFDDHSTWGTNWYWDFGDGTYDSTSVSPGHSYAADGTYYACLTVSNACGSDTFCDSVDYMFLPVSVQQYGGSKEKVKIFPLPAHERINVESPEKINRLEIINTTGEKVLISATGEKKVSLSLTGIPAGIYFMKLYLEKAVVVKKLIVE
jgi:hypothetical protein